MHCLYSYSRSRPPHAATTSSLAWSWRQWIAKTPNWSAQQQWDQWTGTRFMSPLMGGEGPLTTGVALTAETSFLSAGALPPNILCNLPARKVGGCGWQSCSEGMGNLTIHIGKMNAGNLFTWFILAEEMQRNFKEVNEHFSSSSVKCHESFDKTSPDLWFKTGRKMSSANVVWYAYKMRWPASQKTTLTILVLTRMRSVKFILHSNFECAFSVQSDLILNVQGMKHMYVPGKMLCSLCVHLLSVTYLHRCAHLQSWQTDERGRPVCQCLFSHPWHAPSVPLSHLPQHLHLLRGIHGNSRAAAAVTGGHQPAWCTIVSDSVRARHQFYTEYIHWYVVCGGNGGVMVLVTVSEPSTSSTQSTSTSMWCVCVCVCGEVMGGRG